MSDANWGNTRDETIDLINRMEIWCEAFGATMPKVDSQMRLDVVITEFNKLKREFWFGTKPKNKGDKSWE